MRRFLQAAGLALVALAAVPHAACISSRGTQAQRVQAFTEWLAEKKVSLGPIEITSEGVKGGLGLRATGDLTELQVFASIPLTTLLNIEHVFDEEWSQRHLDPLSDTDAMSLFLARIRRNGDSAWDPYIQLLPHEFPTSPMFYTPEQAGQLQRSVVREFAERRLARARDTYAKLDPEVQQVLSESDFAWGLSVLWSRSHGVMVKDSKGVWQKAACFVPVADLLNTASGGRISGDAEPETPNSDCKTNDASTHFECYATRAVRTGEELLVPYGSANAEKDAGLSNGQLLLDYGFALENNRFDRVVFSMPALRDPGSYELPGGQRVSISRGVFVLQKQLLKSALKREAVAQNHTFQVTLPSTTSIEQNKEVDDPTMNELMTFARIWSLDDAFVRKLGGPDRVAARIKSDAPSRLASLEHAASSFILREVVASVKAYGTTVPQDKLLLAALPVADDTATLEDDESEVADEQARAQVMRSILHLRMGEKRLLNLISNAMARYLQTLLPALERERATEAQKPPPAAPKAATAHDEL